MLCATWSHPNRKRALKCRKKMHTYGSTLRYKRYTHTALRKVAPYGIHIAAVHVITMVIHTWCHHGDSVHRDSVGILSRYAWHRLRLNKQQMRLNKAQMVLNKAQTGLRTRTHLVAAEAAGALEVTRPRTLDAHFGRALQRYDGCFRVLSPQCLGRLCPEHTLLTIVVVPRKQVDDKGNCDQLVFLLLLCIAASGCSRLRILAPCTYVRTYIHTHIHI